MSGLWGKGDQEPGKKYSDRIYLSDWPPAFRVTFAKLELPWSRKISTAIDEREQKVYRKRLWPTPVNVRFGWMLTASKIVIHLSKNLQLQGKVFLVSFPPESNRHYGNVYKTETLRKSLCTSIWTTEEKNNILNETSQIFSHLYCTIPSPSPTIFWKKYILLLQASSSLPVPEKFFECSLVGLLDICTHWLSCGTSWQYQQICCFGGSRHHKQLLHCNPQPAMAWHGRLELT